MARLETQINQIYLINPESKKNSLVLYEEQLNNSLQLFIVAELWNMTRKTESNDLKKILEIILGSFKENKKLPAETLFETSLSQINQNLADLAHEGRKSWVGKFSCVICAHGGDNNIYLANNGQTAAWLKRKSEMMEILPAEKRGTHPLKTFVNFTQGKLTDKDSLILTTSNIFNYISFGLFTKILDQKPLDEAGQEITKILQDAKAPDMAFCSFMLHFAKAMEISPLSTPAKDIYAPLPENEVIEDKKPKFKLKLPAFSLPTFSIRKPNFEWLQKIKGFGYFKNLSKPGKFFVICFGIFLLLFLINLSIYASKIQDKKTQVQITQLVEKINQDVSAAQSALIYKDENQAITYLNQAIEDYNQLLALDPIKAQELDPKIEQVKTVINKINIIENPTVFLDLKHSPLFMSKTPIGFLFGNQDSNSLSRFDETLTDYFLLNSLTDPITAIDHTQTTGVIVLAGSKIYRIDPILKQFEPIVSVENGDLTTMLVGNSAIYTLDKANDQLLKILYTKSYRKQISVSGNVRDARDFGIDKDIYILYADKITKYVSGQLQAFPLPNMSDPLTNGDKIQVASSLYILEANKKRVLILNKNGTLINQIYFPTTNAPTDFYVDEASRSLYLLDGNKLFKVTI
ncbi:MAG: hypothetical protein A3C49_00590 [Candidatus Doudnabacteria bacterium RIFCSPHIGHO2_02_FULL_42_25]|uniref:PPM-type phosphatase domain-containing protein n=1 Tax=Candidatus Doudnabacteria bacterium RIFCSPHIGHO2_01_FULL_41_86 TaxID=1817821 RepID=A0A1F5N7R3_9BACT|nr:MAG: hypothetical protein A2717_03630 [Candidatus Doudnabacteria bacterium RIFCSPHIGHO2_01_FULL_41_86]OGE74765.1 MAG: hypothetical protein A3K07_03225 [Candidatus Doudnabacteria bacterium RIFCSPHIGHO2_01_43_10]OGE85732.1 MAG: hypothetical protein A3E28_02960 [Candidatus Doudnabacteria bacterium RIFCSPHIGHO2_12_FULL_42_22]OGE87228.1 MAG: hypothetical protein A3C49_00590 [Candidatus Doudnabacteria bacterium RIFCSPHIGHO2_02_FULL_42_25]OGE92065.1 MAG: hypothetical protein A2895_00465 [Candidatus